MILKQWIDRVVLKLRELVIFYCRAFYDPRLYRDVAFREKGYGLKRVYLLILILLIPSFIAFNKQVNNLFNHEWKQAIESLPYLTVKNGLLKEDKQLEVIKNTIDPKYFLWVKGEQLPMDILKTNIDPIFVLNEKFLWVKMPTSHYMGFQWFRVKMYFPILQWGMVEEPVMGRTIFKAIQNSTQYGLSWLLFTSVIFVNILYATFFIRLFGFVARVMARFVMNDKLEYGLTCRMLSLSAIPTLCFTTLYLDFSSDVYEEMKYIVMGFYMFYFYLSIRFIRAKSSFKWLNGILDKK